MIRSLVSQLSTQCASASAPLDKLYAFCNNGAQQPNSEALMKTLHEMLGTVHNSFIILDALDECVDRRKLLANIQKILSWNDTKCHILATSRKERDIEDVLQMLAMDDGSVCIQTENVDNDIRAYVRHRLQTDPKLKRWRKEQQIIEDSLMHKAAGMYVERLLIKTRANALSRFRWAVCQLDALGSCRSLVQLRKALQALPKTLDETYDRILCKIEGDDQTDAFKILQWLAFSAEPLSLEQLVEVIAIDISATPQFDVARRFEDPLDVLEICSSLVTVYHLRHIGDVHMVRLAHFSVKEYLISDRTRSGPAAKYFLEEIPSHVALTKDCIAYLLQVNDLNTSTEELAESYPLLTYAMNQWIMHARLAEESTGFAIESIQEFFMEKEKAFRQWPWAKGVLGGVRTPLHYASATGLIGTVKHLIDNGAPIDALGGKYGSPLQIAAWEGRISVVKLLLDYGANVNVQSKSYGTPLQMASYQGHVDIVSLLLDRGAGANDISGRYSYALYNAAFHGRAEIVQLLLDGGSDINVKIEPGILETVINVVVGQYHTEYYKILGMLLDAGIRVSADVIRRVEQSGIETLAKMFEERGFSTTLKSPSEQERSANLLEH